MKFFHGARRPGPYFEGWYFKHQSKGGSALALIPAFHVDAAGRRGASLQIISEQGSWYLEFPDAQFQADPEQLQIRIGDSCFDRRGIKLHMDQKGLLLRGTLSYGPFTALKSDIMGPFRFFAGMQCSHGVLSMGHLLKGSLELNGERIDFSDGVGYIETDRGCSFPNTYLWSQCVWGGPGDGSVMLAIATIPLPVGSFTGCICAIYHHGQEYRLATYQGAKIEEWSPFGASIRQGRYRLDVRLPEGQGQTLRAPVEGSMERAIHESLCANVSYRFGRGKEILFQHTDACASFEYADKTSHS